MNRAVVYLGNLRQSTCYKDSLGYAVDARFVTKEFFEERHDDFVLDLNALPLIHPTSLLSRGTKFKGCQRANPDLPTRTRRRRWDEEIPWDAFQNTSQEYLPRLTLDDPTRPASSANMIPPHALRERAGTRYPLHPDQWPVEVTIHNVNWETLTLSATMEAQNVPSHAPLTTRHPRSSSPDSLPDLLNPDGTPYIEPSGPPQLPPLSLLDGGGDDPSKSVEEVPLKTITTYLEGEILDFRHHTLLTESYPSTPTTDITYWRKLPPFSHSSDTDLTSSLLSKSFLSDLMQRYVLMRWKEKCFVTDGNCENEAGGPAEGCGMTISGFYYVCLDRATGGVEGLYCDPMSSPYQHLVLERDVGGSRFWGWEFK
jgi:hypothetical protein